jgi:hypothetical protein
MVEDKSYCSTQVNLPSEVAEIVRDLESKILPNHLHPTEKQDDAPHITVLYGLQDDDPSGVRELVEGIGSVQASITGVEVFRPEDKDYDVLIMTVDSPDLCALNQGLARLPHTDTFPVYRPHSTIVYLVRGAGDGYKTMVTGMEGKVMTFNTLLFSDKNEKKTKIPLVRIAEPMLNVRELEKSETVKPKLQKIVNDFVSFCVKYLKLKDIPKIKFIMAPQAKKIKAFGQHRQNKDAPILLDVENRQPMDILRTLAHELVHHKQDEGGKESSGATSVTYRGNKKENEANKIAGILVRNYAVKHPDYFALGTVKKSKQVFVIMKAVEVKGFTRTRKGKMEHVKPFQRKGEQRERYGLLVRLLDFLEKKIQGWKIEIQAKEEKQRLYRKFKGFNQEQRKYVQRRVKEIQQRSERTWMTKPQKQYIHRRLAELRKEVGIKPIFVANKIGLSNEEYDGLRMMGYEDKQIKKMSKEGAKAAYWNRISPEKSGLSAPGSMTDEERKLYELALRGGQAYAKTGKIRSIKKEMEQAKVEETTKVFEPSTNEILGKLKSGEVKDLKATILWRAAGSTEALIDISGQKFVIDSSDRLKLAEIETDYSKRKVVIHGVKTGTELKDYLKKFPKLGREHFK